MAGVTPYVQTFNSGVSPISNAPFGEGLPKWTIAYDGLTTFGQLTVPWIPTGADWEIKATHILDDIAADRMLVSSATALDSFLLPSGGGDVRYVFTGGASDTPGPVYATGELYLTDMDSTGDLSVNAVNVIDEAFTLTTSTGISNIGKFSTDTLYYSGQIQRVELIDNNDPSNSIIINAIIQSNTQPTDFNIYNALTGLVIGAYTGATYELAEGV